MVASMIVVPAKDQPGLIDQAERVAAQLHAPTVLRRGRRLAALCQEETATSFLLVRETGLEYHQDGRVFAFHLGFAGLRVLAIKRGQEDYMATAMALHAGDSVLDCTLGLASDAVVASFLVGAQGRVLGIESSQMASVVVAHGLAHHPYPKDPDIEDAMRRIVVEQGDHQRALAQLPDNSFDVVYFDPMFRRPIEDSDGIGPLRLLANPAPLNVEAVKAATRVAKKRVVIKERQGSAQFARLGVTAVMGGRYRPLAYGVITCE